MERRYLVFILAFVGAFLLFNSNIQGNVVRVTQATASPSSLMLTVAPSPGLSVSPYSIICNTLGTETTGVNIPLGSTLPASIVATFTNTFMPNVLKTTNVIPGLTMTQTVTVNGNFVFGTNDAPVDIVNYYYHVNDGQKTLQYDFLFNPAIKMSTLQGKTLRIIGRDYYVSYAAMLPSGLARVILEGCTDENGYTPVIQLDGNSGSLFVKINNEVIEDISGYITIVTVIGFPGIAGIRWNINVDAPPGYNNLDLPAGDLDLNYLLDEPQALLDMDAYVNAIPSNINPMCGTQVGLELVLEAEYR